MSKAITCPRCNRETPAEKWKNRGVSGWHYYCVRCRHHWTPKESLKKYCSTCGRLLITKDGSCIKDPHSPLELGLDK